MARWRRFVWVEVLIIAATCFAVLMTAKIFVAPWVLEGWNLFPESLFAVFVTGIIALVCLGVLNAGNLRQDPWKRRDRTFERRAAWWVALLLLSLSLTIVLTNTELERLLPTRIFFPALVPAGVVVTWLLFRTPRAAASESWGAGEGIDAKLRDRTLPEETRAAALRDAIRGAASREDELRRVLPLLLAQPMGAVFEAAMFAVLEECRDVAAVESLLISSLTQGTAEASVRAAHLLAWFGTAAAIEPLTKVTGPGADAAGAAISRIRTRVHGDAGALSIASVDEGRLSIAAHAGALTVAKRNGS